MGRVLRSVAMLLPLLASGLGGRAAAAGVKPPDGPWTEVVTEHYDVFGNAYADHLREAAARLEQLRALLAEDGLGWSSMSGPRTVVCAFRDERTFAANILPDRGKRVSFNGAFRDPGDSPTIVIDLGAYDWERVIAHEGVHAAVACRYPNAPRWLHEGLAQTFAALRCDDGVVTLAPAARQAYQLYFRSRISLRDVFAPSHGLDADRYVPLYRWSWGFVYYVSAVRRGGADALHRFADDLNRGLPALKSFESAFGCSYETIQEEMDTYFRDVEPKRIPLSVAPVPLRDVPEAMPLPADEALFRLGDVMVDGYPDLLGHARVYIERFLRGHPGEPRAVAALAQIDAREGKRAAAAEEFERAIQSGTVAPKVYVRAAWNLVLGQMHGETVPESPPATIPQPIARARSHLGTLLHAQPRDSAALWLLGLTYAWDPGDPAPGIDALRRSDAIDPLDPRSLEVLLRYLVRAGNLADARAVLENRLVPLEDAEVTDRARKILSAAEEASKSTSSGGRP